MPNESQGHREYIGKWWYPWDGLTINPHTPYIVGICWVYPFLKGSTIFPMTGCNLGLGFTMLNYSEACNFSYLLVDACSQPMRRPEVFHYKPSILGYPYFWKMEIVHFQQRNKYISKSKRKSPVPCPSFFCDYRAVEPKTMIG